MHTSQELQTTLRRIDGRGYKAYKDLRGSYQFPSYTLYIDHVQADPFAFPSRMRVLVPQTVSQFPESLFASKVRKIALEDYVTRQFGRTIDAIAKGHRGTGKSGRIQIDHCGQEILERTSAFVNATHVEIRFTAGLPARGRTVLGREAQMMLCEELPEIVRRAVFFNNLPAAAIQRHVEVAEDQEFLRQSLRANHLVAFLADGAILPRRSGIDDRPLPPSPRESVVPFDAPASLEVEFELPHR